MTYSADEVLRRFAAAQPRFTTAALDVEKVLREALASRSINPEISSRVKDLSSFRKKVALPKYRGRDLWSAVTDKVGVRVTVDRKDDVDRIHEAVVDDGRLAVYDITDKRAELTPSTLGYSGLHLDVYAPAHPGDTEPVPCEVQIRTHAQHAWSVVSHKLLYKPPVPLSQADQRAIMRLVALVEVFDEEVQRVMDVQAQALAMQTDVPAAQVNLVDVVSAQFGRLETEEGNEELSALVMTAVGRALDDDIAAHYATVLDQYVTRNIEALTMLYEDYGPSSGLATSADYVLWSQPESLAVLESLESRPHRLYEEWLAADLPVAWLESLASHTDDTIDFDVPR